MTQQKAQSANFGPMWPEVTGFGAGPNKQFIVFFRKEKCNKYATVDTVALLADLIQN